MIVPTTAVACPIGKYHVEPSMFYFDSKLKRNFFFCTTKKLFAIRKKAETGKIEVRRKNLCRFRKGFLAHFYSFNNFQLERQPRRVYFSRV